MVHTKLGEFVRTSSPGCSAKTSEKVLSPRNIFEPGPVAEEGVAAPFSLGGDAILWERLHRRKTAAAGGGETEV